MIRLGLNAARLPGLRTSILHNNTFRAVRYSSTDASQSYLSWNDFLAKRFQRRRLNLFSSVIAGFTGMFIGGGVVFNMEIDPTEQIYGYDITNVMAAGLILCGFAGALLGPTVGSLIFKLSLGKNFPAFNKKNAEFLGHIQRNRPDPSKQTMANPVPDYYGEKIGSLKDYRRWLRDGNAFKRKVETFL